MVLQVEYKGLDDFEYMVFENLNCYEAGFILETWGRNRALPQLQFTNTLHHEIERKSCPKPSSFCYYR